MLLRSKDQKKKQKKQNKHTNKQRPKKKQGTKRFKAIYILFITNNQPSIRIQTYAIFVFLEGNISLIWRRYQPACSRPLHLAYDVLKLQKSYF